MDDDSIILHSYPVKVNGYDNLMVLSSSCLHFENISTIGIQCIQCIQCNYTDKIITVYEKPLGSKSWKEKQFENIKHSDVIDVNDKGERWEGDSLNGLPFGYGCYYDSQNNIIYHGFMCEFMKIGKGTTFYPDTGCVEYNGNFYKNLKHGYGTLYDKMRNIVYCGNWVLDQPKSTNTIQYIDKEMDLNIIHYGIERIMICDNFQTSMKSFCLIDYNNLYELHIGDNCLSSIRTFQIERCDSLYSIEIGKRTCIQSEEEEEWNQLVKDGDLRIAKCPELSVIIIGDCSFGDYASSFILYSIHSYYYYQLYRLNKLINITY